MTAYYSVTKRKREVEGRKGKEERKGKEDGKEQEREGRRKGDGKGRWEGSPEKRMKTAIFIKFSSLWDS